MIDYSPKTIVRRRKSLLTGLSLLLIILGIEFLADLINYKQHAMALEKARAQHSLVANDSQKLAREIDEIEDGRTTLRLVICSHISMLLIAAWCLNDALRIHGGKEGESEKPTKAPNVPRK